MDPVTLTTDRLLLRAWEAADADAVHAACQDPDIPRWTSVPAPYTPAHAREFVGRTTQEGWRHGTSCSFGVFRRDGLGSGPLVGSVGLARCEGPQRQAELGYWTVREQRRRGYAAEAARAVCRWAFGRLGVERLEWYAQVGNTASRAVALATGFRMEGTLRARLVHRGTRRDAWVGSLLPSDWDLPSDTPYLPRTAG